MKKNNAMNALLGAFSLVSAVSIAQSSQAAVLFDISGGSVPLFAYSKAISGNNVVNVPSQPALNSTGSTIFDTSNTANWIGSVLGTNSMVTVTGLSVGQTYSIAWSYAGSESGDVVRFTSGGLSYAEHDLNNNNSYLTHRLDGPVDLGIVDYGTITTPSFTVKDLNMGGSVTNGGPNAISNNGTAASLIFAYAKCIAGVCTLQSERTDTVVFGFNDNGGADDDHDDFMGIMRLIPGAIQTTTPIPGALPLFGSVFGGGLGLLRWRRKRKNVAAVAVQ